MVHPATACAPSPASFQPDWPDDGARETDEERTERHLAVLKELTEIGMRVARAVEAQATGEAAPDAPAIVGTDLGLTLSRIARAVRQTVALEAKLAEDRRAGHAERTTKRAQDAKVRSWLRKSKVQDIVERAIEAQESGNVAERLLSDLTERLMDPDEEAVFADRPLPELVGQICRDLGVTPPQGLWDDADWELPSTETPPDGSGENTPPETNRQSFTKADVPRSSSPGGGGPRNAVEGEHRLRELSERSREASFPLRQTSFGPPPPAEEEKSPPPEPYPAVDVDPP